GRPAALPGAECGQAPAYTRPVVWERWRDRLRGEGEPASPPPGPFDDLLEPAPIAALLLDRDRRVLAANQAARHFFRIDLAPLPLGLLGATREGRLLEALRARTPRGELPTPPR